MEIQQMTAVTLAKKIKDKEISVKESLDAYFNVIDKKESQYHAYITIDKENAYRQAENIQKKIDRKELTGSLTGTCAAVKDNICTKGIQTSCGSKILKDFVPAYSAQAVENLQNAGIIIIGKTNMDEFGMGSTTENSYFGATKNPHGKEYVPGGSSGGSAAAVALGECSFALGSDTGGSVRQPASYCGIVGMKPTYGTVSRYGLVAYGSSLEQIGSMTKNVSDCAAVLEHIASYDKKDSRSVKRASYDFMSALTCDIKGIKIGVPKDCLEGDLNLKIKEALLETMAILKSMGAYIEEFDMKLMKYALPAYYIIASAEASSNLARFDGVKYGWRAEKYDNLHDMYKRTRSEGFGQEVKRRIMLGTFVLSSGHYDICYEKAVKVKKMISHEFDEAFEKYDIILTPTATETAPRLGLSMEDPMKMYESDVYTTAANLTGNPAMSIPCKKDKNGLPIGMQLMGKKFHEDLLLRVGYAFETARKAEQL